RRNPYGRGGAVVRYSGGRWHPGGAPLEARGTTAVAMEIVAGVHAIDAVGAKVLLLVGDRLTLVDAGGPGSAGRVLGYIVGLGRRPEEVERIVVTHGHIDHVGALAELRRATGAQVCAHESEAGWV